MPSLTRSDLVNRIGDLIGDPDDTRWTAAQKQDKIQEAQEQFVADTRCLVDTLSDSIVANTAEYALPTDVLDINRVAVNNLELERKSKFDLDFYMMGNKWSETKGTPKYYYADLDPNNKKIRLYPIPQSADVGTNNLVFDYVKIPPTLSSDSSIPFDGHTLLTPYHMAIAYYAARELLVADATEANLVKARVYKAEYDNLVSKCVDRFRNMAQSKPNRMKGGRVFKGI